MKEELNVVSVTGKVSTEAACQILKKQVLAKVLTPGTFELGLHMRGLMRYSYAPGEIILCRRNTEEWVRWQTPVEMLMVTLPDASLRSVAEEIGGREPELEGTSHLEDDRVRALIAAVEAEKAAGYVSGRVYLDAIGVALSSALMRTRGVWRSSLRQYRGGLAPVQLRRIVSFVHEHLDQDLSLSQMAEEANLSPAYFSQMFHQSTGLAPHQFLLKARVERAKNLLQNPALRVMDVAIACGFQNQQHFARVFRNICAMSPTQFRRMKVA